MKRNYRVVVIGGGVVGTSVLYHLAKFGWSDCCLLERSVLAAGSSWHAAGGVHPINADPNMAALQAYTIDLLHEIEKESEEPIGYHMEGGVTIACAPERWEWLLSRYRIFQTIGIEDSRLMTRDEIKDLHPFMNVDDVAGGLWTDREGFVDTTGTVRGYASAAKKRGADVIENNRVLELIQRPDNSWEVVTEKGTIHTEHVINAAGLWAKQVGRMVGLELPVSPLKHHYFITDSIPELADGSMNICASVDPEGFTYSRRDQDGMLVGFYELEHEHWCMDGAPWDYGMELFEPDVDRISDELDWAIRRYPVLGRVGVKTWIHGAFTFSPDGNPLVGPVREVPNYWLACGVMAGFLQGGGVGKTLAEWIIHGEPETDPWAMDIGRYGKFASNREYIKQTTGQFYSRRFVMTYPNEQLWGGRPLKTSPSYNEMTENGARWGESWGMEVPIFFGPREFEETPTLRRSNAFDIVSEECKASRNQVGLLDISGYSRFKVTGTNARKWLDWMFASRLPEKGHCRLAPALAKSGRLMGDLVVLNWDDDEWWIMGSYYLREWHMRWFAQNRMDNVDVTDISDATLGFSIFGPKSRELLQMVADKDVSNEKFPFMGLETLDIGLIRTKTARITVTGELGYEINCAAVDHLTLYNILKDACDKIGGREVGFYAVGSLRLEKSFGIWSAEFRNEYTPGEAGVIRWIDFDKGDFIGRSAVLEESRGTPKRRLVTLEVKTENSDATGYEPIWHGSKRVGFITSGGYGHTIQKSLAMGYVDTEFSEPGTKLTTHIISEEFPAEVIKPSPHDPMGKRMRS